MEAMETMIALQTVTKIVTIAQIKKTQLIGFEIDCKLFALASAPNIVFTR